MGKGKLAKVRVQRTRHDFLDIVVPAESEDPMGCAEAVAEENPDDPRWAAGEDEIEALDFLAIGVSEIEGIVGEPPTGAHQEPLGEEFFRTMDWTLLRDQKAHLLEVLSSKTLELSPEQEQGLHGILHLLDGLQDFAADKLGLDVPFFEENQGPTPG